MLILAIIGLLFIFLGFAIHKLKWYFLIAGYNTSPKDMKKNVDTEGLGKLIGSYMYFIGGLFILIGIFSYFFPELISTFNAIFIVIFIISTILVIIKAQKYDHNKQENDSKSRDKGTLITLIITIIVLLFVGIMIFRSLQPIKININDVGVEFKGMYGDLYRWEEIEELELRDKLPTIELRTNGSSIAGKDKGYFKTKEYGKVKLYLDSKKPPFIYMKVDGQYIIINLGEKEKTIQAFEKMENIYKD
ncbi:DUF3784 domain-containing protein [Soehngenia longivitae]|uniref:DUF3784 domain-containing protein n=1 Tax=Soehngenia longivitae TaxID=2562294 RepID=A0A4Z0D9X4_9FIRM|nr:DUF3784 domain-containing protein [Soehngenia longivitae]TFZ41716.1 DUF3784 domain-containing protein [Soehngenia longivitae]